MGEQAHAGEARVTEGEKVKLPSGHPPVHDDIPLRGGKREPTEHEQAEHAQGEGR